MALIRLTLKSTDTGSNQISIDIFVLITTNGVNSWEEEQRKASVPILTYEDFRKNKKTWWYLIHITFKKTGINNFQCSRLERQGVV